MDLELLGFSDRVDPKLALPVLREAYRLVRKGWVQNFHRLYPMGTKVPARGPVWPLWRALSTGTLAGEHAKRVVRRVIGDTNVSRWEDHRFRTRDDVLRALATAIEICGARAPRPPRRGGWSITSGPVAPPTPKSRKGAKR